MPIYTHVISNQLPVFLRIWYFARNVPFGAILYPPIPICTYVYLSVPTYTYVHTYVYSPDLCLSVRRNIMVVINIPGMFCTLALLVLGCHLLDILQVPRPGKIGSSPHTDW